MSYDIVSFLIKQMLVGPSLYCTICVSETPIICAFDAPMGLWIIQDIILKRPYRAPVGILLRNSDDNLQVCIDSIFITLPILHYPHSRKRLSHLVRLLFLGRGNGKSRLPCTSGGLKKK